MLLRMIQDTFWQALEQLLQSSELHIDRPKGSAHPRRPELIYPFDYGELLGTVGGDGASIDVCLGQGAHRHLTGVLLTADVFKRDAEIKLLLGCSASEMRDIAGWYNQTVGLPCLLVLRPHGQ